VLGLGFDLVSAVQIITRARLELELDASVDPSHPTDDNGKES